MIVAATQFAPVAGDIAANVDTVAGLVRAAGAEGARVVVFAELCLSGYEPTLIRDTPELVLTEDDPRLDPVREACRAVSAAAVVNGPVRTADGRPAITTLVVGPEGGLLARYDKQHLYGIEREVFAAGTADGRFTLDGVRFATATCYDNRFLELAARAADDACAVYLASSVLAADNDSFTTVYPVRARDFGLSVVLGNVLVRNENGALPLRPGATVALSGAAARDARILGGGSAQVFPDHVVSPLDGITAALADGALTYHLGADPSEELTPAGSVSPGFTLRARCRDASGAVLGEGSLPNGQVQWIGDDLPAGVTHEALASIEVTGTFTPRESGEHSFGTRGLGAFTLAVGGETLYDGVQAMGPETDPFEAFFGSPVERAKVTLTAGETVEVSLLHTLDKEFAAPLPAVMFSFVHLGPRRDPDELIAEAVEAARTADTAVVVVATTERVESEGFDRKDLALPGRQDDLVRAVAAVNPNTVVVVNAGSPVELPWRGDVAAVLLGWFPGQEGGAALADVLTGAEEPGGRLPTTWPVALADVPVTETTPTGGRLDYAEGLFVGYRAWDRAAAVPAYAFGHGLGYTTWSYDALAAGPGTATVRLTNTGDRAGREVVQVYLAPVDDTVERPARWLAGFASVGADPGETVEARIALPRRAFEIWDEEKDAWTLVHGRYEVVAARSLTDARLTATVEI